MFKRNLLFYFSERKFANDRPNSGNYGLSGCASLTPATAGGPGRMGMTINSMQSH